MKDQTRGTPAFLHRYLWPLLAFALLAIPMLGMWELFRAHRPFSPISLSRLFIVLVVIELLAIYGLFTEYLTLRKLFSEANIARDRLRLAMTSGRSMGWEWDLASGRDYWFGDLQTMFGIQSDTWYGNVEDFSHRLHPDDRQRISQLVAEARTNHKPYNAEFRVVHQDGSVHWIRATGSFHYNKKDQPERMLGMAVDITAHKQIQKDLHESEQRLRSIVESAIDAIVAVDEKQKIVLFNAAAEKMFGCSAGEAIGSSLERFIPGDLPSRHERHIQNFGESETTSRNVGQLGMLHGIRTNGEEFPIEASISYLGKEGKKLFTAIIRDVTDRHQAEETLRRSEQRLRLAVQAGRMYVDDWDVSSDTITRSPDYVDVLGKDQPPQITRQQLLAQIHPDDRERIENLFASFTPENPMSQCSYRLLRSDSNVIWLEKSMRGVFDDTGRLLRAIAVVADITERKQAEERFQRVVEHISDAIMVDDADGQVIFANDRFLHLFGLDRAQLHNLKIEDYVAPEYRAELRDRHDRRMRGEPVSTYYEYEGIRGDGQRMWLEADVVAIADQTGGLVGTQSAIRDVTERRLAALALQESEERFRLVANTAPVMIWMAGPDKLCDYFNQQWLDFTGRPLDAELGDGWVEGVHPDDVNACLDTYSHAFDRHEACDMQYRLRRRDGEYRWLDDRGVPRFNSDGSFAGYIGSCYDVTERKLADETLGTLGRRLIDAHEEERTWIARELHDDINQRLALITIELEKWKQQLPESAADVSAHIDKAGKRLFEISKDVQSLSHRLHSSKLEYLGLATAARSFCKELSEQHKVRVQFSQSEVPANLPHEVSLALFRILQESLQNAVKHSQAHDFEVDLRGGAGEIVLVITDRGVGFDQDHALHSRGLGLISMRERLQLVNGTLAIESKPGHGTTIRACAPLKGDVSRLSATG